MSASDIVWSYAEDAPEATATFGEYSAIVTASSGGYHYLVSRKTSVLTGGQLYVSGTITEHNGQKLAIEYCEEVITKRLLG